MTNTWGKFGFQKVIRDDDDVFYFKFTSATGLEQVLEKGPWLIRNQPLILTKWTPNLTLSKDNVTKVPVWVKIQKVHVVAYVEDGLSLIATQIGKPIMLDAFTSSMCNDPWGRIRYARALIEVSTDKELKKEVTIAILIVDGEGYTMEKMSVEYEWKPPCCNECKNRKRKGKKTDNGQARHIEGLRLNKPKPNYVWNVKSNQPTKPKTINAPDEGINIIKLKNNFTALQDQDDTLSVQDVRESSGGKEVTNDRDKTDPNYEDSDSDVEEVFTEKDLRKGNTKVASTPSTEGPHVYVYAILESHVDLTALSKVCYKVFCCWVWSSNANLYTKGCRIILGWNKDVVDVMVVAQSNQAIHTKIFHKDDNKSMFYTFVYAGNNPMERRHLWTDLELHKNVVRRFPWILMGDFNATLNMEDSFSGSSQMNSAMCDFKDCVKHIKVIDINSFGLHYKWNQKPKGRNGILKKLDRIMGNIEFVEGHSMFWVVQKMKALKKPFRKLLHDQGNLHDRVNWLRFELDEVQKAIDLDPSNCLLRDGEAAYIQAFNEAKIDEERFLKQKAKIEWLADGDSNSAYFHKSIKIRNQRSRIDVIRTADNVEVTGNFVPEVFVSHYESFLGASMACADLDTTGLFTKMVSESSNSNMTRQVTNEEIKHPMFDIRDDKAPASIGKFIHTFPCAFKVDIQKAYNTVDWRFLGFSLKCFSFHQTMIKWIMASVTSPSFSISINGGIHGYFKGKRGIRQGDPLSPYLFTLVMETLTLILQRRVQLSDSFRYYKQCEELQIINVCFANDLFLFARGDVDSAKVIMDSLDEFKQVSGLVPSIPKSTAFFCNVFNHVKIAILNIMPFFEGEIPVKYLGVSLISSRLLNNDCKVLVEKDQNRIGKAKVAWEDICLPKREGGLGLHSLEIGNGLKASLWYDMWCTQWPLSRYVTKDIVREGHHLRLIASPMLNDMEDCMRWRDGNGNMTEFSVKCAWEALRPRGPEIPWYSVVWFSHYNPRHAFHLWLVMRRSLKTQDKLRPWDVWCLIRKLADIERVPPILEDTVAWLQPMAAKRTIKNVVGKLLFVAASYYIWLERNNRLFKNTRRSPEELRDPIMVMVRLKLVMFRFKNKSRVIDMLSEWKMPTNFRLYSC
ncbi:hypothetical protein Tco_0898561 [Tanacetum coccineum]